jgi:hypothetical protein
VKLPISWIVGGVVGLAVLVGIGAIFQQNQTLKAKLEASQLREKSWAEQKAVCDENEKALTDALVDIAEKAEEIENLGIKLEGREEAIHRQAVELAKAKDGRAAVLIKYQELSRRAVTLDVCQTYESVLAALAGEGTR